MLHGQENIYLFVLDSTKASEFLELNVQNSQFTGNDNNKRVRGTLQHIHVGDGNGIKANQKTNRQRPCFHFRFYYDMSI